MGEQADGQHCKSLGLGYNINAHFVVPKTPATAALCYWLNKFAIKPT
jgi:hypothetical protein